MKIIRQGDVSLRSSEIPKTAKKIYRGKQYTLAYGEVTGHSHVITADREVIIWEDVVNGIFVEVVGEAKLTHGKHAEEQGFFVAPVGNPVQEDRHGEIEVSPDIYKIEIEREYDPFLKAFEKVID